jgi:outer membrane immunogenic protein
VVNIYRFGSAALLAAWTVSAGQAADAPSNLTYKAPAPAMPASSWSGFYAGLGLGFRADRTDSTSFLFSEAGVPNSFPSFADLVSGEPVNGSAFRAAPYLGWNWQVAPHWVVGIEGDVGFANRTTSLSGFPFGPDVASSGFAADKFSVKTSWDASARGRLGFLVTPSALLYATGGPAWQHFAVVSTCAGLFPCVGFGFTPAVIAASTTKTGGTFGAGFESALWGHWLLRGEYRFSEFGSAPFSIARSSTISFFNPTIDNVAVAMRTHTATFGLAYKFGDAVPSADSAAVPVLLPVKATPVPVLSWSGPYLGLGLGLRASRSDATTTSVTQGGRPVDLTNDAISEPSNGSAFRAAPYLGWNWQVAPKWVVGVEGDVGFADQTTTLSGFPFGPDVSFSGNAADGFATKTSWDASARARLGYLVTPSTLVYAAGGAAWQHFEVTSTCGVCGFTPAVLTNSATRAAATIGAGFETALWGHWLLRGDYRYADFGDSRFTLIRSNPSFALVNPTVVNFIASMRTQTATLGLAYKLDWGATPLVAKY